MCGATVDSTLWSVDRVSTGIDAQNFINENPYLIDHMDRMARDMERYDAFFLFREGTQDIAILREAGVDVGSISNDPEEMRGDLEKALGTS